MSFPGTAFPSGRVWAGAILLACAVQLSAQNPSMPNKQVQREAMQKLSFLAGHWSGPVTIIRGPGEPLHLTQTENVQFKLDSLVLLIEGQSTDKEGRAQFQALATIAYDDASRTYRVRAYNDGRYLDTELAVQADGFSWGFSAGPAKIQNTMRVTAEGEWQETTEVSIGSNPPKRTVEMLLRR